MQHLFQSYIMQSWCSLVLDRWLWTKALHWVQRRSEDNHMQNRSLCCWISRFYPSKSQKLWRRIHPMPPTLLAKGNGNQPNPNLCKNEGQTLVPDVWHKENVPPTMPHFATLRIIAIWTSHSKSKLCQICEETGNRCLDDTDSRAIIATVPSRCQGCLVLQKPVIQSVFCQSNWIGTIENRDSALDSVAHQREMQGYAGNFSIWQEMAQLKNEFGRVDGAETPGGGVTTFRAGIHFVPGYLQHFKYLNLYSVLDTWIFTEYLNASLQEARWPQWNRWVPNWVHVQSYEHVEIANVQPRQWHGPCPLRRAPCQGWK